MVELDSSNGIMFPYYDEDINVIFLCGKVRIEFLKILLLDLLFSGGFIDSIL
jgi:hypothetical protein